MVKFLVPALSAAILSIASVSTAAAGPWGAYYPQKAHNASGDQSENSRRDGGRNWGGSGGGYGGGSGSAYKGGYGGGSYGGGSTIGGGSNGGGGTNGGAGDGVSRSAPGPVLGLGLPALAVAGGYVFARRRAKKK